MCLSFLSEDKGENVEPHGVSRINISAQSASNVSAPVILNSTVKGNINISNYFPGEWKCSLLVEMPLLNIYFVNNYTMHRDY